jgi:flagellar assembly protein FliH
MTLSSPEVPARAWSPAELTAVAPAAGTEQVSAPVALFELAAVRDVPESLLAPARRVAESAGYTAGWQQGMAAASAAAEQEAARNHQQQRAILDHAREQVATAIAALRGAAADLAAREAAAARDLEQLVLDTAFGIAEALTGAHLADDEQRGAAAVRRVLDLAPAEGTVIVRLSAADHAVVDRDPAARAGVTLVADATLQPGDARASIGATTIDARLSAALERVRSALTAGPAA